MLFCFLGLFDSGVIALTFLTLENALALADRSRKVLFIVGEKEKDT